MKTTKRILSIALALLLGLALLVPAAASALEIVEKKLPPSFVVVFSGDTLKLEIDITMREYEGATYDLEYLWYDYAWQPGDDAVPIASGPKLEIPITKELLVNAVKEVFSGATTKEDALEKTYCVAVNRVTDEGTYNVARYSSNVFMLPSTLQMLQIFWEGSLAIAGSPFMAAFVLVMNAPLIFMLLFTWIPVVLMGRLTPWMTMYT